MSKNELELIKIEESLKNKFYVMISVSVIFVFILSLISVFSAPQMSFEDAILTNILIWSTGIVFIFVILYKTRTFRKRRYFEITDEYLLFDIPNKSKFKLSWSSFDGIEIKKEKKYRRRSMQTFYTLAFKGKGNSEELVIQKGFDYTEKTIKKILKSLEEAARIRKKNYYMIN
ncbi:MAG: hypothetical protein BAJALOKI2v1_770007 [Promethearchaeota archaeon]|nr:MAG: hypothetical protein BAJALOKI2v1_770007 [Candidatus Lokiarchaeota archaeon]